MKAKRHLYDMIYELLVITNENSNRRNKYHFIKFICRANLTVAAFKKIIDILLLNKMIKKEKGYTKLNNSVLKPYDTYVITDKGKTYIYYYESLKKCFNT